MRRWPANAPRATSTKRFTIFNVDQCEGLPERLSYATIARRLGRTSHEVEAIMVRVYFHLVCSVRDIEREAER